jgi:DNA modification methylase
MLQSQKGKEQHLCPMQFDIADRVIERFSNPGDTVFDPFSGIGSVGYRALIKGRKFTGTELSPKYFMDAAHYLKAAEHESSMPDLFGSFKADIEEQEKIAA